MKSGPNYFACTFSTVGKAMAGPAGYTGTVYQMNTVNATMTSLPVIARGGFDKSFQINGTASTLTTVRIDVTLDPTVFTSLTSANIKWSTLATITPSIVFFHPGIVYAFRAVTTFVSGTDSFGVLYAVDDRGG